MTAGAPELLRPAERRRDAATRAIERTAIELFTRRGFAGVSVDDVAAACGISQRTFFRYFDSKADVLLGYRRRLDERLLRALRARPATEDPVTALRNAYLTTSTVPPEDRGAVLLRARAVAAAPDLLARTHGEQVAGTAAVAAELAARLGGGAGDARARVIAAAVCAVAVAEWDAWVAGDGSGDPADRIAAAITVVERGLGAPGSGGPR